MKRKGPSKWSTLAVVLLALLCFTCATSFAEEVSLEAGVNIIRTGAVDKVYNIDTGKAVMICGTDAEPIRFENCTFNLSGETVKLAETKTAFPIMTERSLQSCGLGRTCNLTIAFLFRKTAERVQRQVGMHPSTFSAVTSS